MLRFLLLSACLLPSAFSGCSPTPKPLPINQREEPGSIAQIKKDLALIAEHGSGDSALQPLADGIAALDKSSPHFNELTTSFKKLSKEPSPEKRKEIAKSMIETIGSTETK